LTVPDRLSKYDSPDKAGKKRESEMSKFENACLIIAKEKLGDEAKKLVSMLFEKSPETVAAAVEKWTKRLA